MELIHGDCLKEMFDIPDNSVDMVCCDMPYGTTACKWDTVLPLDMLWYHYKRICKDNAAIVLNASQPFTTTLINSNLKVFAFAWVWDKKFGANFVQAKRQPIKNHEDICVFTLTGKQPKYYPQMIKRVAPIYKGGNKQTEAIPITQTNSAIAFGKSKKEYSHKFPISQITFNCREGRGLHPTQKPVALIEYLIKTYTNEGDTVLDNCMGSGTTGVACKNLNRDFIGIELNEKYFEIAKQRIEGTQYNQQINRTQKDAPVI
jgi:site-specific DNA-methyltransferase (adenine-specific)